MKSGNKVVELESLRGLAAVIVAVGHYFYGFLPAIHTAALGTPYFAFFNGGASVVFFFVLSGYVLSIGPLKTGNLGRIVISALKRWPRLAGPVLIVSAISGILSVSGLYFNEEAGRITGSGWLRSFNFAFEGGPSLSDALYEGAFSTFFAPGGSNQYNAVLWTMHYEFIGSMIVFALVAVLLVADKLLRGGRWIAFSLILLGAAVLAVRHNAMYIPFVAGATLALIHTKTGFRPIHLHWLPVVAIFGVVFYFSGFISPRGHYEYLKAYWPFSWISPYVAIHTTSSVAVMMLALFTTNLSRFLSRPAIAKLGEMSFPLYLVHLPIYCSLTSVLAVALIPVIGFWAAVIPLLIISTAAVYLCSIPLTAMDRWWTDRLRHIRLGPWLSARIQRSDRPA